MSDEINPYEAPQTELQSTPKVDQSPARRAVVKDIQYFLWSFVVLLPLIPAQVSVMRRLFIIAVLAEVIVIFIVSWRVIRSDREPTKPDRFIVRWGLVPLFIVIWFGYGLAQAFTK